MHTVDFIQLPLTPYDQAYQWQLWLHQEVLAEKRPPTVLLLEHFPCITLGKHAAAADVLLSREQQQKLGIKIFTTDRGGQVTMHMPGQLVAYPVLPLAAGQLTPRQLVCRLEEALIRVLGDFGVTGQRNRQHPGVWVQDGATEGKIAAIGLRITQRVSRHGLSLNVNTDNALFQGIVPCGILGARTISLSELCQRTFSMAHVQEAFMAHFCSVFQYSKGKLYSQASLGKELHAAGIQL